MWWWLKSYFQWSNQGKALWGEDLPIKKEEPGHDDVSMRTEETHWLLRTFYIYCKVISKLCSYHLKILFSLKTLFWKVLKSFIEKYNFSFVNIKTKPFHSFIVEKISSFSYLGKFRNSWTWDKLKAPNSSKKIEVGKLPVRLGQILEEILISRNRFYKVD